MQVSYKLLQIIVSRLGNPSNIWYSMSVFVLHTTKLPQSKENINFATTRRLAH